MEKKRVKLRLEIYKPKGKIKISKEDTMPFLIKVGGIFASLGGVISFVVSGVFMGIKSFFDVKQKVYSKNIFHRKYVELKVKKWKN